MTAHGFLVISKPPGPTSMDVVRRVKRLTRERKVGHGGTLDPIAAGVLPICFGQATRLMEPLVDGTKVYSATVTLGIATDTYDSAGAVTATRDPSGVTRGQVETALERFRGDIVQVPPMYSALKRGGERLYDLARAGIDVHREPRSVSVSTLELLDWTPPDLTLVAECGRGVYIRSLAHDLGEALGCGGHLSRLTRQRTGPFSLDNAVTLEDLASAAEAGRWQELLYSTDTAVAQARAAVVGPTTEAHVLQGRQIALGRRGHPLALHGERCRLYSTDGRFLALARFDRPLGLWQPEKVFDATSPATGGPGRRGRPSRPGPRRRQPS